MEKQKHQTDSSRQSVSPCQVINRKIENKMNQLNTWSSKLEILLNDSESEIKEIDALGKVIKNLNKDLLSLKDEQRKLNCIEDENPKILDDNQTIISTSSVRRKTAKSLQIIDIKKDIKRENKY